MSVSVDIQISDNREHAQDSGKLLRASDNSARDDNNQESYRGKSCLEIALPDRKISWLLCSDRKGSAESSQARDPGKIQFLSERMVTVVEPKRDHADYLARQFTAKLALGEKAAHSRRALMIQTKETGICGRARQLIARVEAFLDPVAVFGDDWKREMCGLVEHLERWRRSDPEQFKRIDRSIARKLATVRIDYRFAVYQGFRELLAGSPDCPAKEWEATKDAILSFDRDYVLRGQLVRDLFMKWYSSVDVSVTGRSIEEKLSRFETLLTAAQQSQDPEEARLVMPLVANLCNSAQDLDELASLVLELLPWRATLDEADKARLEAAIDCARAELTAEGRFEARLKAWEVAAASDERRDIAAQEIETCWRESGSALDLANLNLRSLPEVIGCLPIEYLKLEVNRLKTLPPSIGLLRNLKCLDAGRGGFESLPESIGLLRRLGVLDLPGNKLRTLPESVRFLEHLGMLTLCSGNPLRKLPESLGKLPRLSTLVLDPSAQQILPKSLKHHRAVRYIRVVLP